MYVFVQMIWLVHKLARCLRVNVPSEASTPSVMCKIDSSDAGDFHQQDGQQSQEDMTEGTTDKLLVEIHEIRRLLQTQIRHKAAECKEPREDVGSKNDWKLAAAVFDRFLLISFCTLLVAGTVVFLSVFTIHYHPSN